MEAPRRIASLLASATEILYGIGLGDRVVAVSHECDYPAEVVDKPRVTFANVDSEQSSKSIDDQVRQRMAEGAPLYEVDVEQLLRLAPDLIVTQAQCDVCAVRYEDVIEVVRSHEALRDTKAVALNPTTLDDIFNDILRVGEATNRREAAKQYVDSLHRRVAAVESKSSQLAPHERPRVACIEWIEPLMIGANWMPRLVQLAGGRYDLVQAEGHSTYSNWDDVINYDPQVIIVMPCGFDLARTVRESSTLTCLSQWNELSAVASNRVFAVDGNAYFNRSGPRIVDSLEILAHLIHPSLFADPLPPNVSENVWRRL